MSSGMGIRISKERIIPPIVSALCRHNAIRVAVHTSTPTMKIGVPYNGVNAAEDKVGTYVAGWTMARIP
jgi:hypothetical protein